MVGAGQIAGAHQKLSGNLAASKSKSLFKQFYPLFLVQGMMVL